MTSRKGKSGALKSDTAVPRDAGRCDLSIDAERIALACLGGSDRTPKKEKI